MRILAIIFLCLNFWTFALGARILGVFHVPTSSHNKIGVLLMKSLAERGHQVTIVSGLDPKLNSTNVRYIYLDGVQKVLSDYRYNFDNKLTRSRILYYIFLTGLTNSLAEQTLKSNALKKLMSSGEKFDVVFIEPFLNQALMGFGQHFNSQIIVLSTSNSFLANILYGNEVPYSFVPNTLSSYTDKMNFGERLSNTFLYWFYHILHKIYNIPDQRKLYNEYFPNGLGFDEAVKKVSLHFVNSHVMYESPRPYLPNMVQIGGLHVQSTKQLPKDIQEYLDNAKQGVIYFSLGSYIQSMDMTVEKRNAILNAFAEIPQKVLWKFEVDLPGKPDNVKISKWFPQNDILAHPNVKLFITHGGLLSTVEAVYRAVPTLGMPFIFDQFSNTEFFANAGFGEVIEFSDLTKETFLEKIQKIVYNSSYKENILKASKIIRDQNNSPLERAVFWTEHIIKHGSNHLRPASLDLNFVEYLLLDVALFIILNILFICLAVYYIIKIVLNRRAGQKHHKKE